VTPDYYALLNVVPDADPEIVRAAYLVLAKRYHPDMAAGSPHGGEKFQLITEAYEVLRDPDRRAQYDRHHGRQRRHLAQREKFENARRWSIEQAQRKQGERPREEHEHRAARAGARSRSRSVLRNPLVFAVGGFALGAIVFGLMHSEKFEPPSSLLSDKAAQNQELADLRQALHQVEGLSEGYQELLVQERARNLELEEQLAARRDAMPAPEAARPTVPEAPGNPEPVRLMARANLLLDQGNIGVARIVLERAAEMGSASALFALAETYDPAMLAAWRTFGTQGDAGKARELYARAFAGGIREAKDRLNPSRQ
jgi:curved DNA-binding protein CbpA